MNIKDIVNSFNEITGHEVDDLHWGSAYSLWEVCRHKVIGIPVLDLFIDHVDDSELKRLIQEGIELNAIPHVEKLQRFLKDHDLTYPPLPARRAIDDQQIGRAIKEILRLSLNHEMHAFMSTTRDNERDLFWNMMDDDKKAFDRIIDLDRKKGWLLNPPNLTKN
jgi:hypothetical protein